MENLARSRNGRGVRSITRAAIDVVADPSATASDHCVCLRSRWIGFDVMPEGMSVVLLLNLKQLQLLKSLHFLYVAGLLLVRVSTSFDR
jgi:hypothetical protein